MPKVTFVNENVVADVEAGTSIRNAAKSVNINTNQGVNGMGAGINKFLNCKGMGMCGTCRVLVTEGMENTTEQGMREKKCFNLPFPDPLPALAYTEYPDTMRLACMCKIEGDITVETGPEVNLFGENYFS